MISFHEAVKQLYRWEGGYQDYPQDVGNYNSIGDLVGTNFGITPMSYQNYTGVIPTIQDMKNIDYTFYLNFVHDKFFIPYSLDSVTDQNVVNILLDTLYLFSKGTSNTLINNAIANTDSQATAEFNYKNAYFNINDVKSINKLIAIGLADHFINNLVQLRIEFHNQRVLNDSSQSIFLKGWTNRALSFTQILTTKTKSFLLAGGIGAGLLYFFSRKKKK